MKCLKRILDFEKLTRLGLGGIDVNAIEVPEFDGDPPLCQVGLGGFDRLRETEKKLGPVREKG